MVLPTLSTPPKPKTIHDIKIKKRAKPANAAPSPPEPQAARRRKEKPVFEKIMAIIETAWLYHYDAEYDEKKFDMWSKINKDVVSTSSFIVQRVCYLKYLWLKLLLNL
jgi:hypothetical protein